MNWCEQQEFTLCCQEVKNDLVTKLSQPVLMFMSQVQQVTKEACVSLWVKPVPPFCFTASLSQTCSNHWVCCCFLEWFNSCLCLIVFLNIAIKMFWRMFIFNSGIFVSTVSVLNEFLYLLWKCDIFQVCFGVEKIVLKDFTGAESGRRWTRAHIS